MQMNEYQEKALRTMNKELTLNEMMLNASLGICGEGGEIADTLKKCTFQNHPYDEDTKMDLLKELGDVMWYISLGAYALGVDLETVARMNVDKLMKRYPQGFDADKSINRSE